MTFPKLALGKLLKPITIILIVIIPAALVYYVYVNSQREYFNQRNFRALGEITEHFRNHIDALDKLFLFSPTSPPSDHEQEKATDQEKNKLTAYQTYSRRLQLNEFFKDIVLKEETDQMPKREREALQNTCEDLPKETIFFLRTISASTKIDAFQCPPDPSTETSTTTTGRDHHISPRKWWVPYSTAPVPKQNAPKQKRSRLYFRVPIRSLLGGYDYVEFDSVLLSDSDGEVLYQKDHRQLEWSHGRAVLQEPSTSESVSDLRLLISQAQAQLFPDAEFLEPSQGAGKGGASSSQSKGPKAIREIGQSAFVNLPVEGKPYRIYIYPFKLPYHLYKQDEAGNTIPVSRFYAVGLVSPGRFQQQTLSVPVAYSGLGFLLLVGGLSAWPFLKTYLMSARQAITRWDIRFQLLSLNFTLVFAIVLCLTMLMYWGLEAQSRATTMRIADQMIDDIRANINEVVTHLRHAQRIFRKLEMGNAVVSEKTSVDLLTDCLSTDYDNINPFGDPRAHPKASICQSRSNVFSCIASDGYQKLLQKESYVDWIEPAYYPALRDIFAVNPSGDQCGPILFFSADDRVHGEKKLKIGFRDYFREPREGRAWYWNKANHARRAANDTCATRFYVQRIYNFSDGQKATQISMPFHKINGCNKDNADEAGSAKNTSGRQLHRQEPSVIAATTYLPALSIATLPASFDFAVIDDATGRILYHSKDDRSFVENFFAESDYSNELIAAIQKRYESRDHLIKGSYHGRRTNFYVTPIKDLPWSLVIYHDANRLQQLVVKTAAISVLCYMVFWVIAIIILWGGANVLLKSFNVLWPHPGNGVYYKLVTGANLLFFAAYMHAMPKTSGWALWALILGGVIVELLILRLCRTANEKWVQPFLRARESRANPAQRGTEKAHSDKWPIRLLGLRTASQKCERQCQWQYIIFIVTIFVPIAVLPAIGLFKEAYSATIKEFFRLDQVVLRDLLQERALRVDKYARTLFPSKYDLPTNTSRLRVEKKVSALVYGVQDPEESKEMTEQPAPFALLLKQCDEECLNRDVEKSRMPLSVVRVLASVLRPVTLHLAEQYYVGSSEPEESLLRWLPADKGARFRIYDSIGPIDYETHIVLPNLWDAIKGGLSDTASAGPEEAGWNVLLIVFWGGIALVVWLLILSFFCRKVLGIHLRQPFPRAASKEVLERIIPESQEINENQLLVGASDEELTHIINILEEYHSDSSLGVCKYDALAQDWPQPNDLGSECGIVVVENLDRPFDSTDSRKKVLQWLEVLAERNDSSGISYVFIRTDIPPMYRIMRPHAYPSRRGGKETESVPSKGEVYRWAQLFSRFEIHYFRVHERWYENEYTLKEGDDQKQELLHFVKEECSVWPELISVCRSAESALERGEFDGDYGEVMSKDQAVEFIRAHAEPYYRQRWELCTWEERLTLYQLALDKYVNPENEAVIESLYMQGYILRDPYFKVANLSFKRFVVSAEAAEDYQEWERAAAKSLWSTLKMPLFASIVLLGALLLYVASESIEVVLGLMPALLAALPMVLRAIGGTREGGEEIGVIPEQK